jgi:hypothetical protein
VFLISGCVTANEAAAAGLAVLAVVEAAEDLVPKAVWCGWDVSRVRRVPVEQVAALVEKHTGSATATVKIKGHLLEGTLDECDAVLPTLCKDASAMKAGVRWGALSNHDDGMPPPEYARRLLAQIQNYDANVVGGSTSPAHVLEARVEMDLALVTCI